MVLFPRIGTGYWIVTDFYETFCAVPVTLVRKGGLFHYGNGGKGLYTVEWRLAAPGDLYDSDTGYVEEYDVSRRELFRAKKQACKVARILNSKGNAMRQSEGW